MHTFIPKYKTLLSNRQHIDYNSILFAISINSYMGHVQLAGATQRPPSLKAMSVVSGFIWMYENCVYRRGVFELVRISTIYHLLIIVVLQSSSGSVGNNLTGFTCFWPLMIGLYDQI